MLTRVFLFFFTGGTHTATGSSGPGTPGAGDSSYPGTMLAGV